MPREKVYGFSRGKHITSDQQRLWGIRYRLPRFPGHKSRPTTRKIAAFTSGDNVFPFFFFSFLAQV